MRVISFNCEGIKNAREKGLFDWLVDQDADVICLQDIREDEGAMEAENCLQDIREDEGAMEAEICLQDIREDEGAMEAENCLQDIREDEGAMEAENCLQDIREDEGAMEAENGWYQLTGYNCYAYGGYDRKDRGGVAIYTRQTPKAIIRGLGFPEVDETGRYIQADFDKISIVSLYVPEGHDAASQNFKYRFLDNYSHYLNKQRRKRREFIMAGTWNIAHRKIDVANWRDSEEISSFQSAERGWMEDLLGGDMGFFDAYREVDRESGKYSWWQNEFLRHDNLGMRIDYQIITAGMRHRVLNGGIYKNQVFSCHAPIIIDFDWELEELTECSDSESAVKQPWAKNAAHREV